MLAYMQPSNQALPIDFPHFAPRGAARLSFPARIEGAQETIKLNSLLPLPQTSAKGSSQGCP